MRDIASNIPNLQEFPEPSLRDQEWYYRLGATRESSLADRAPVNEYDAMMRAAPGESVEETIGERQELRESVVDAVEGLTERQQFIIDAVHSERLSHAQLGVRLGVSKTQANRLLKEAEQALRELLLQDPMIRERMKL